jgi:hypothetical protein
MQFILLILALQTSIESVPQGYEWAHGRRAEGASTPWAS